MRTMKRTVASLGAGKVGILAVFLVLATLSIACEKDGASPLGPSVEPESLPDTTGSFAAFGQSLRASSSGSEPSRPSEPSQPSEPSEPSCSAVSTGSGSGGSSSGNGSDCEEPPVLLCPDGTPGAALKQRGLIRVIDGTTLLVGDEPVEIVEGETEFLSRVEGVTVDLASLTVGLPVKVEGIVCGGVATATRLVLLDKLEVTGVVFVMGGDGTFTLLVEGLAEGLNFVLAPDAEVEETFGMGDVVEVEARVTADLATLFLAMKVEVEDDGS